MPQPAAGPPAMLVRFITSTLKLAVASLVIGAILSFLNVSTAKILAQAGLTPEDLARLITASIDWALPKMFLGALFVVPTWCLVYLMRPPKGYE
jgi:hypothetical protein